MSNELTEETAAAAAVTSGGGRWKWRRWWRWNLLLGGWRNLRDADL
jgi:hypothetical protein